MIQAIYEECCSQGYGLVWEFYVENASEVTTWCMQLLKNILTKVNVELVRDPDEESIPVKLKHNECNSWWVTASQNTLKLN